MSAHSPASFVGGGVDRFSFRLVPLLVRLVSCGVSSLFFAVHLSSRLAHQFAGGSLRRLVRRSGSPSCSLFLGVSPCPAHCFSSRVFSSRPLVSSSSPYSLVSSGRLVSAARRAGRILSVSRLVLFLFSSHPSVASHGHDGDGSSFLSRYGVFPSRCPVVGSDWAMTRTGWVCRSTIRWTRRFR